MAGYYGKIQSKGDFISRDLPREIMDKLHEFFSVGLQEVREELGESWLEHYSVAPIWFFYLQPGILDQQAYIGIWMSSVDRVNRHFPFTVLQPITDEVSNIEALAKYKEWFFAAEELLLDTLEADIDASITLENIATLQPQINESFTSFELLINPDQITSIPEPSTDLEKYLLKKVSLLETQLENLHKRLDDYIAIEQTVEIPPKVVNFPIDTNLSMHVADISQIPLIDLFTKHSVWFSAGNGNIASQLFIHEGLPKGSQFTNFLIGWDS